MTIAMEGRAAANQWVNKAKELNERTKRLLDAVSETLKSVRQFSEGTLVDEIVDLGSTLMTATTKLMNAMNEIFNVVNKLLDFLSNLITGSSQNVKSTRGYIE